MGMTQKALELHSDSQGETLIRNR